jgi:hypothetical protein
MSAEQRPAGPYDVVISELTAKRNAIDEAIRLTAVTSTLHRALKAGNVVKVARGQWSLPEETS